MTPFQVARRLDNLEVAAQRPRVLMLGGTFIIPGAWPWYAEFLDKNELPYCGGTLIAEDWILTAAHCGPVAGETVRVGGRSLEDADGVTASVAYNCIHKDYVYGTLYSDIALVRLTTPLQQVFASRTSNAGSQSPGTMATAVGWGRTDANAGGPPVLLQQASFPIVNDDTCRAAYSGKLEDKMMCAGTAATAGPCVGDSGGPLLVQTNTSDWLQVGVTSWGNVCSTEFPYGVYTKVSEFANWITDTMTAAEPECKEEGVAP